MDIKSCNTLIDKVKVHGTAKELDFLNSIVSFFKANNSLTPGQDSWYTALQVKYSEQNLSELEEWKNNWSDENRKIATRIAAYYSENPPYFQNYVSRIHTSPESFVLSKREWDKFCENKYAKKIRAEYDSEEKYKVGQLIQVRKTNKIRVANDHRTLGRIIDCFGFVLEVNSRPITRAAKGSRIYTVLLTGATSAIFCHESDIKNARKKN